MLNSVKKLSGCRIVATDGEVGAVAEAVYFDDEQWVVRYLVVDTGGVAAPSKGTDLTVRGDIH